MKRWVKEGCWLRTWRIELTTEHTYNRTRASQRVYIIDTLPGGSLTYLQECRLFLCQGLHPLELALQISHHIQQDIQLVVLGGVVRSPPWVVGVVGGAAGAIVEVGVGYCHHIDDGALQLDGQI